MDSNPETLITSARFRGGCHQPLGPLFRKPFGSTFINLLSSALMTTKNPLRSLWRAIGFVVGRDCLDVLTPQARRPATAALLRRLLRLGLGERQAHDDRCAGSGVLCGHGSGERSEHLILLLRPERDTIRRRHGQQGRSLTSVLLDPGDLPQKWLTPSLTRASTESQ